MKTKLPSYKFKDIYTEEVSDSFSCDDQVDDVEKALLDLKQALTIALYTKVDSLKEDVNKWRTLYYKSISEPCEHLHFHLEKDDNGTHFVCSCCGKIMKTRKSAEAFIIKP